MLSKEEQKDLLFSMEEQKEIKQYGKEFTDKFDIEEQKGDIKLPHGRTQTSYLAKIVDNISDTVVKRPNCKLCMSKYRAEVEKMYSEKKMLKSIMEFLKEKGEVHTLPAISNHCHYHYDKQHMDLSIKEYIEDVCRYKLKDFNKKHILEERRAMLTKSIISLAAQAEGKDLDTQRKNLMTVKSLSDSILNIEIEMDKIDKAMEPVFLFAGALKQVITDKIKDTDNQEVKTVLLDIWNSMSEQLKSFEVEVRT